MFRDNRNLAGILYYYLEIEIKLEKLLFNEDPLLPHIDIFEYSPQDRKFHVGRGKSFVHDTKAVTENNFRSTLKIFQLIS